VNFRTKLINLQPLNCYWDTVNQFHCIWQATCHPATVPLLSPRSFQTHQGQLYLFLYPCAYGVLQWHKIVVTSVHTCLLHSPRWTPQQGSPSLRWLEWGPTSMRWHRQDQTGETKKHTWRRMRRRLSWKHHTLLCTPTISKHVCFQTTLMRCKMYHTHVCVFFVTLGNYKGFIV
jgi:hypothetical protein